MKYLRSIYTTCVLLLLVFFLASCDQIPGGDSDEEFTITFESNGGNTVESITDLKDTSISQPTNPTKDDFIFAGWFLDTEFTEAVNWPIILDKDYTLYAKWNDLDDPVIYTVNFNTNGGSEITSLHSPANDSISKPVDPTKADFEFIGWFFDEGFENEVTFPLVINGNITLYAKWEDTHVEPTTYEVSFNTNGGSTINTLTVDENDSINKPIDPTKTDFEFIGWFFDEDFENKVTFPLVINATITLYAKWEEIPLNKVSLSYYQMEEVNIVKVIPSYSPSRDEIVDYVITNDGRLLTQVEMFNQITFEEEIAFAQYPLSMYGFASKEKIIDAISYEPVLLVKTESGIWYGAEIGQYATGEFLGVTEQFISINEFLSLAQNEFIVDINAAGRLFYCFTNLNRVFIAGRIEFSGVSPIIFDDPLDITSQFNLQAGEYFIPNNPIYRQMNTAYLVLRTNKRIFIPSLIAKLGMQLPQIDTSNYFIDIDALNDTNYDDLIVNATSDSIYIQLMNQEKLDYYMLYDGSFQFHSFPFNLNPNEVMKLVSSVFITNQNRYFTIQGLSQFAVDGEISEILFAHTKDFESGNVLAIFKTIDQKYKMATSSGQELMIKDITLLVDGYAYKDGYFIKDGLAYCYDYETDELILNQFDAFIIQTDLVDKDTLINEPSITDDRYEFMGWSNMPEDGVIRENLILIPIFNMPILDRVDLRFIIDDFEIIGYSYTIPLERTYTAQDFIEIYNRLKPDPNELEINLEYLEIDMLQVNKQTVESVYLESPRDQISVYLKFKENATIATISYETPLGYMIQEYSYGWVGVAIDFEAIEALFKEPIEGFYSSEDYSELFVDEVYTNNTHIFVKVTYPMSTVILELSHDQGSRTIEYVTGYSPNLNELYDEFSMDNPYRIVGFYSDELYQNEIETYEIDEYDMIYVKLGQIVSIDFYGVAGDKVYTNTVNYLEGLTFDLSNDDLDFNYYRAVGYYYDEAMSQEIDSLDVVLVDIETIYVKFEPISYDIYEIRIVGLDNGIIQYKAYDVTMNFAMMLRDQGIYIGFVSMYADDGLTNLLGYAYYYYYDMNEHPSIIYIDGNNCKAYRFIDEENEIDVTIIAEPYQILSTLSVIIYEIEGYDEFHIYDQEDVEVFDLTFREQTSLETLQLEAILWERGSINLDVNGVSLILDDIRINRSDSHDNQKVQQTLIEYFITNEIEYDDVEFYVDEAMVEDWNGVYLADMTIYIKIIIFERTDVYIHVGDSGFLVEDLIVDDDCYFIFSDIEGYLIDKLIDYDNFEVYQDPSFEVAWYGRVSNGLELYVMLMIYPRTNVTLHLGEDSFVIEDVLLNEYDRRVYNETLDYLDNNNVLMDLYGIYYDPEFKHRFYGTVDVLNMDLYIEVLYYERVNLTINVLGQSYTVSDYKVGYDNLYDEIRLKLYNIDIYEDYLVYTDASYENLWNVAFDECTELYILLINPELKFDVLVMYEDVEIYQAELAMGSMDSDDLYNAIFEYLYTNEISFDSYQVFTNSEMSIEWNFTITEDLILYVETRTNAETQVNFIYDGGSFMLDIMSGISMSGIVYSMVEDNLDLLEVPFDYFNIYIDSSYEEEWGGEVEPLMTLYVDIINYDRTSVFLHMNDEIIEVSDVLLHQDDPKINMAIMDYVNEYQIVLNLFNIYIDENLTLLWRHEIRSHMHLYVEWVIYERYSAIAIIEGEAVTIDGLFKEGNEFAIFESLVYEYLLENEYHFDGFNFYADAELTIEWDGEINEGDIIYIGFTYETLEEKIYYMIWSENFTYFQTSEAINFWMNSDYVDDELYPVTYYVEDQDGNRFIYMSFLTNGNYYEFYQSNEYYGYYPTLEACQIERYFDYPIESTLLDSLEEINGNEIVALEYPVGFATMEEFLDAVYLTPEHNFFVLYNIYFYDDIEYRYVDVYLMIGNFYRYWSSIPLVE